MHGEVEKCQCQCQNQNIKGNFHDKCMGLMHYVWLQLLSRQHCFIINKGGPRFHVLTFAHLDTWPLARPQFFLMMTMKYNLN